MIEQWGIALFGVVAIALTQDSTPARQRYACLFGLAGQPFWFYAAWKSQQWGIGLLTLLYTLGLVTRGVDAVAQTPPTGCDRCKLLT